MTTLTPYRSTWDPFRSLTPLSREFFGDAPSSLLSRFFEENGGRTWSWAPRFDVIEKPEAFVFQAELPGMKAEEVDVTLSGDLLTIKGEKKTEEVRTEDHFRISERSHGTFERSFTVPAPIDPDSLDAEMKDGVLHITVAKSEKAIPAKLKVKSS